MEEQSRGSSSGIYIRDLSRPPGQTPPQQTATVADGYASYWNAFLFDRHFTTWSDPRVITQYREGDIWQWFLNFPSERFKIRTNHMRWSLETPRLLNLSNVPKIGVSCATIKTKGTASWKLKCGALPCKVCSVMDGLFAQCRLIPFEARFHMDYLWDWTIGTTEIIVLSNGCLPRVV